MVIFYIMLSFSKNCRILCSSCSFWILQFFLWTTFIVLLYTLFLILIVVFLQIYWTFEDLIWVLSLTCIYYDYWCFRIAVYFIDSALKLYLYLCIIYLIDLGWYSLFHTLINCDLRLIRFVYLYLWFASLWLWNLSHFSIWFHVYMLVLYIHLCLIKVFPIFNFI